MKYLMLLIAVLFVAHTAPAAEGDGNKALELVRAMRSDEISLAGAKHAFISGALDDRFPRTHASCVRKIPPADFSASMARVVATVLKPTEIEGALKFYRSDAGVKYVDGILRRLRTRLGDASGIPDIAGTESVSPAQVAAISDFTSSALGRKVTGKDMSESPAALQYGRDMLAQIAAKCSRK
jgi:hypothetical protein